MEHQGPWKMNCLPPKTVFFSNETRLLVRKSREILFVFGSAMLILRHTYMVWQIEWYVISLSFDVLGDIIWCLSWEHMQYGSVFTEHLYWMQYQRRTRDNTFQDSICANVAYMARSKHKNFQYTCVEDICIFSSYYTFNSSPLKNDGWKTTVLWDDMFSGAMLNFRWVHLYIGVRSLVIQQPLTSWSLPDVAVFLWEASKELLSEAALKESEVRELSENSKGLSP